MNKVIRDITLFRCTQQLSWDVSCLIARDIFSVKLHDVRNNACLGLLDGQLPEVLFDHLFLGV